MPSSPGAPTLGRSVYPMGRIPSFADLGFYTHFSYTDIRFGGSVRLDDVSDAALATETLPPALPSADIDLGSGLHMMGLELGWEFDIVQDLVLRRALGWSYTVAAHADVDVLARPDTSPEIRRAVRDFEGDAERAVKKDYKQYCHPPTLGIGVGWRF